jgi:hypothetical protein
MQDFLLSLFKDWFAADGDVFCWFNASGQFAQYSWGVVENPMNLATPKYAALAQVAANDASWKPAKIPPTVPTGPITPTTPADPAPKAPDAYAVVKVTVPVAPCTVNAEDAACFSGMKIESNTPDGSKNLGYITPMGVAGFLVATEKVGRYGIMINLSGMADSMQLVVSSGLSLVRATLKSTGSWQNYVDVLVGEMELPAGVSMLQVISLTGGINIRSVTLKGV